MDKKKKVKFTEEQEKEIQARVSFKLNQFKDYLVNTANREKHQAFDPNCNFQRIAKLMESYEGKAEIVKALKKEIDMAVPSKTMHQDDKNRLKNRVIDNICERYNKDTRGICIPQPFLRFLVNQIEILLS